MSLGRSVCVALALLGCTPERTRTQVVLAQPSPPVADSPPPEEMEPFPTLGAGSEIAMPPNGRVHSIEEHPFAFVGSLYEDRNGQCEGRWGMTFADMTDFGGDWLCTREVEGNEETTLWSIECDAEEEGHVFHAFWVLSIAREPTLSDDGRPHHRASFARGFFVEGVESRCTYFGAVVRRRPEP
jgi:hypothetical protein